MSDVYTFIATIGPGLAEGLAAIGSTIGIMEVIASGIPTVSEEPGMRGKVFILAFLPMTQTLVYGFSYMFLSYFLILPGLLTKYNGVLPSQIAGVLLIISLYVGFSEFFSAWKQGQACAQATAHLIKTRGGVFGTGMILAVYEEFIGVLGMVFGLVMLFMIAGW